MSGEEGLTLVKSVGDGAQSRAWRQWLGASEEAVAERGHGRGGRAASAGKLVTATAVRGLRLPKVLKNVI